MAWHTVVVADQLPMKQLKLLYVAITRARQNLWIADCSGKSEPVRVSCDHVPVYKEHVSD